LKLKILNSDQLMVMNEHDLKRLILSLRSRIKEIEEDNKDENTLQELETYYCYVFRELEHRGLM
jgi:hypothetical protein